jgi:hypothetical protein
VFDPNENAEDDAGAPVEFDPNEKPEVVAGCALPPKVNAGVAFVGAGVGAAAPNAKAGTEAAGCGAAAGCCNPKLDPPKEDVAAEETVGT